MQTSWREPQTFPELLTYVVKELDRQHRRPNPTSAADLLGPGMASLAIRIGDWNDPITLLNGNYYSEPGARHGPDEMLRWTGSTIAKDNGSGMQQVWNTDDLANIRYWMRTYVPDGTGQGATFSAWRNFATPSGYIEFENLEPSVQDQLNDLETAIGLILPPLRVYRQATAPTNPDTGGHALQIGDEWLDTDDGNHPYIWDGTTWTDYADLVLGDLPAQVSAATATAEAAAGDAADALDFLTGVTGPTIVGGSITGMLLQTDPAANTGIKINSAGLAAYGGGSAKFTIDGATGNVILVGTMTGGGSITGPIFQTTATAARGVKITSGGLVGYNSSGAATIIVDAATGGVTILGALTAGSTIDGATVTGGLIQTSATASVGIKLNSAGLVAYGSGVAKLAIDASTGSVVLDGSMTGGGTITGPIFQTSSSGKRIIVDGPSDIINFYSGLTGETAGYVDPFTVVGAPGLQIAPGKTSTYDRRPRIYMVANPQDFGGVNTAATDSGGTLSFEADDFQFFTAFGGPAPNPDAGMFLNGHFRVEGSYWQDVGTSVAWATGWSQYAGGKQVRFKRVGDWLFIDGTAEHAPSVGTGLVFTLPTGYRPPTGTSCWKVIRVGSSAGASLGTVTIDASGTVTVDQLFTDAAATYSFDMLMIDIS